MGAGRYASGRDAWGICDQSGLRVRYRDMKVQWNGLKVSSEWYEEKHPQLDPPTDFTDPQALRNPRPDTPESTSNTDIRTLFPDTSGGGNPQLVSVKVLLKADGTVFTTADGRVLVRSA
jgi:hypothetical protein